MTPTAISHKKDSDTLVRRLNIIVMCLAIAGATITPTAGILIKVVIWQTQNDLKIDQMRKDIDWLIEQQPSGNDYLRERRQGDRGSAIPKHTGHIPSLGGN